MSLSWYLRCVPNLWGTLYSQSSNPFIKLKRECVSVMSRNFRLAARCICDFPQASHPWHANEFRRNENRLFSSKQILFLRKPPVPPLADGLRTTSMKKLKVSLLWSTKKTWRRPGDERLLSSTSGHQANRWLPLTSADFTNLLTTVLL